MSDILFVIMACTRDLAGCDGPRLALVDSQEVADFARSNPTAVFRLGERELPAGVAGSFVWHNAHQGEGPLGGLAGGIQINKPPS